MLIISINTVSTPSQHRINTIPSSSMDGDGRSMIC